MKMAQKNTSKKKMIEKIIGIVKGEISPPKPICILWDDENPENEENIYIINNRQVSYEQWKLFK